MKFDLSSLIITVIAFIAFAVPISIDQLTKKKKAKTMKLLSNFAKKNNIEISSKEVFQNTHAFGFDKTHSKVVYINNEGSNSNELVHALDDFTKCSLYHKELETKNSKYTGATYLRLHPKKSSIEKVDLEMFRTKPNLANTEEEFIAKKLLKAVNKAI